MKRPTLLYNIGIAFIMPATALVAGIVLQELLPDSWVLAVIVFLVTMVYVGHVLFRSDSRVGKISVGFLCLTVLLIAIVLKVKLTTLLMISIGLIWVTRSLLYYSSFLPAIVDLGVCIVSLASALWGFFISGSVAAAIWCFFLTQALSAFIPERFNPSPPTDVKSGKDRFNQAYQSAETAIRHLARK